MNGNTRVFDKKGNRTQASAVKPFERVEIKINEKETEWNLRICLHKQ
jgi:hypothetical protein